jgi:uncharacterized FlaG/YvyC family protein
MSGENAELWQKLCEQASKEQDPKKLAELVEEINRLLEAKQRRLSGNPPKPPGESR